MAAEDEFTASEAAARTPAPRRRRWRIAVIAVTAMLAVALLVAWLARERIAGDIIAGQLEAFDLPATYAIESIGPRRQVLRNIVVGDPARPDLTIEKLEAEIGTGWTGPRIVALRLVRPRFHGAYRDGRFSFGALDPVIFAKGEEPFRMPDLELAVVDGRGLIEGDLGPVGVKLSGSGHLRGGFSGIAAAVAPRLAIGGCVGDRASVYGKLSVAGERPRFAGPLRLAGMNCPAMAMGAKRTGIQLDLRFDRQLDGFAGTAGLVGGDLFWKENRAAHAAGNAGFVFRKKALTARYGLQARGVGTPYASVGQIALEGALRGNPGFSRIEVEGDLRGERLEAGDTLDAMLERGQGSAKGTLAAPLLARMRGALAREARGSRLAASFLVRGGGKAIHVVIPQAELRGGGGAPLLSLSRFQFTSPGEGTPRIAGNFFTGGEGLPRVAGRMERQPRGGLITRLTMPAYRVGSDSIALPSLALVQLPDGSLGFSGEARLSGALPGGRAENLILPLSGSWSSRGGLSVWRRCVALRFDRLMLANLTIDRRPLSLCPPAGAAIVRADGRGLRIAAGAPSLDLAGRLGSTPIRIRSGPIGAAVPGVLAARSLDVALGPEATASRFAIANLDARIGGDVAGRFAGADVRLGAVPLDIVGAGGTWRFANGRLALEDAAFRLEDRQLDDRFQPLGARGASLALAGNLLTAEAVLREPASDRAVVRVAIRHDLGGARGRADLSVDGLAFDDQVQPDTLTRLALGVIANARGTLSGTGRIEWTPDRVTSSGRFSTDSLDFAAAFGPVKGAAGTIEFTDLLGLVTAPGQTLRIASINPGIEVNDGVLSYALLGDSVLQVNGARWPFFDGALVLEPTRMTFGAAEQRRFTLSITGLDAARFVERLELANIAATGTFDGSMPLVFDENGGRIEGGSLRSRPPGGNVSYVGALTYRDLSAMANFAFDALRSLNYREMTIGMDGALEGEIVTRLRFTGVTQGEGAKRNFLTDRVARLPIQFNVNLRAPFFQLISSFKSFYDPEYVRDPRSLGLMDAQGRPVPPVARPPGAAPVPDIQR